MINPSAAAAAAAAAAVAAQINAAIAAQQRMLAPKIYFEEGRFRISFLHSSAFPQVDFWFADVDINHSKTKHILTKGSTHNQVVHYTRLGTLILFADTSCQIHALTGAVVTARGRYKALGDCSNNDPLHLHVSADSEDKLRAAVERIHKIMGPNPLKVCFQRGTKNFLLTYACVHLCLCRRIWQVEYVRLVSSLLQVSMLLQRFKVPRLLIVYVCFRITNNAYYWLTAG